MGRELGVFAQKNLVEFGEVEVEKLECVDIGEVEVFSDIYKGCVYIWPNKKCFVSIFGYYVGSLLDFQNGMNFVLIFLYNIIIRSTCDNLLKEV